MCKADAVPGKASAVPEPSSGKAAAPTHSSPKADLPFKGPPEKKAKGGVVTAKVNHPFTEPKSTEVSAAASSSRAEEVEQDHVFLFAKRVIAN